MLKKKMWGITTYFNPIPGRGKLRLDNFHNFRKVTQAQKLKLCVVELIYDNSTPDLHNLIDGEIVLHVHASRSRGVVWQKERLLNIALQNLPIECDKVCWLDGDIIFERDDWVAQTELALSNYHIVQPFSVVCMLPQKWQQDSQETQKILSSSAHRFRASSAFASYYFTNKDQDFTETFPTIEKYQNIKLLLQSIGGVPGLCWAARREIFSDSGFYDYNVVGGGDSVIHAAIHSVYSYTQVPFSPAHFKTIAEYIQRPQFRDIKIGCVDGLILHMWHGKIKDRNYADRYILLKECNYSPEHHLVLNADQVWEWSKSAPQKLIDGVSKYFLDRKEKPSDHVITQQDVETWCKENNAHLVKGSPLPCPHCSQ